ncbi:pentatricopeptide repeat-containing protein At2g13600-like [Nymphaea colorata]|uniref:Pentacotripeptide-repeat region of PRORP domain-containing protein n=1 Tax=Nymphaea colorata TaxID=210225 RepID=A0A5K0YSW2_9MAGN|nr:pentatricopeptide repeat-containing protein At2g13600-like [Nymphaea colorata]VVV80114.1 unnamed protein product [Nymphaea colorata]
MLALPSGHCATLIQNSSRICALINLCYSTANLEPHPLPNPIALASRNLNSLRKCKQFHALAVVLGLSQDVFVATKVISSYSYCENPVAARRLFDSVLRKNVCVYNSMISGYARTGFVDEPVCLFREMRACGLEPDHYTYASVMKVFSEVQDLDGGRGIHGLIVASGFDLDTVVANSVMSMYCSSGSLANAQQLFDEMSHRNLVSWNILIAGYTNCYDGVTVWNLVRQMLVEGIKVDDFTLASLFDLCGNSEHLKFGLEIHGFIIRNLLMFDAHVSCCLLNMYAKCGRLETARRVFDHMDKRNVVSWTAMASCYAQGGDRKECLQIFRLMQLMDGLKPNRVSLVSVLPVCASLGALLKGKQIHGFSLRHAMNSDASMCNALIDMYWKCGRLDYAESVFHHTSQKDVISWSSMISGYGFHGHAEEAFTLYDKMLKLGIRPVHLTFLGIISACSRCGLIDKGFEYYNSMTLDFGTIPSLEISSCMIDMLGRDGQLERALEFIESMPVDPSPSMWGALYDASRRHGNLEIGNMISAMLLKMEPGNPSNYIALSNTCAASGQWDDVIEARREMRERHLRKVPGYSWIAVNG